MKNKHIFFGFLATLSLLAFYFLILLLVMKGLAVQQFLSLWYWILPISMLFGIQIGLYSFVKAMQKKVSKAGVVVSGSVSSISMIACCTHHLTDIFAVIGLTAIALFLAKYQTWFLLLALASNLFGVGVMLRMLKECRIKGA